MTTLGATATSISALAFVGGTLFATTGDAADALVTLDPLTGAELARVAPSSSAGAFIYIRALAATPAPVVTNPAPIPASGHLLLGGLGGRRRRLAA